MTSTKLNFFWLVIFGLTLPVAVVISTQLARRSFEKVQLRGQAITVKGYAERRITSDYGIWYTTVTTRNPDLAEASRTLDEHREQLMAYFKSSGFAEADVRQASVTISKAFKRDEKGNVTNQIEYFVLDQGFSVETADVQKVQRTARQASSLIRNGIELGSSSPLYFYTKLNEMKLQMLAEASENSHDRAGKLIVEGSGRLGKLMSASQGVFQITPPVSTETSDGGMNDTSSIDKIIKAVVTCEYAID